MPDLLLELFSEEIPARMQRKAAEDLKKLVTDALVERGLVYEGAKAFATPRRLALHVAGLPVRGRDIREERKGPRVGAPDAAIQGFLKAAGLASLDQATIVSDPKKGDSYIAVIEKPGQETVAAIAEIVPAVIRSFPWPKSMRWGKASAAGASLRWVRPLHAILCTFGAETEEPEVVPFEVDGIASGNTTYGHRFHAPGAITVRRFDDYVASLEQAKVVLDADRRKEIILADAKTLAFAQGLELVEDEGLLEEVAGLVEWPVVLMGSFEERFLEIPGEAIRATIRANQKCFVLRDPATGNLANRFLLTSNLMASDGGAAIVAGNERVVRARLSDAAYFFATDKGNLPDLETLKDSAEKLGLDLSKPLDQRMAKLDRLGVVFHAKLGTQGERVQRIAALARELVIVGADPRARRARRQARQGRSADRDGRRIPRAAGPDGPQIRGTAGRARERLRRHRGALQAARPLRPRPDRPGLGGGRARRQARHAGRLLGHRREADGEQGPLCAAPRGAGGDPTCARTTWLLDAQRRCGSGLRQSLLSRPLNASTEKVDEARARPPLFFHDRLKVMLRDQGARHDLVDAVLGEGHGSDDLLLITRRVAALGRFLETEDGKSLLAGYKRAANILKAEEKKDGEGAFAGAADLQLIAEAGLIEEKGLAVALAQATPKAESAVAAEDYEGAMAALADLRPAVDAFFDKVTVNDPDPALRPTACAC